MVDNLNAETRRISNLLTEVPGTRNYGIYVKRVGGSVLAALQEDFVHEPLSSIKVTAHLQAMRQVEAGLIGLDDTIPAYADSGLQDEACYLPDGQQKPLADVLSDMMQSSSNPDWAATVNHVGKNSIKALLASVGMTRTEIRRVGCASLLNRWTLRDAGRLYEGVADGTLLLDQREAFYARMPGKPGGANTLVDEEAPPQMTVQQKQAFKGLFAISRKDGDWTQPVATGEVSAESAVTRIGVARIPGCIGSTPVTRSYVYGVFQNGAPGTAAEIKAATQKAALELLRQPIRTALSQWVACAASATPSRLSSARE